MNAKQKYQPENEAQPVYLHDVTVNGRSLTKGQAATLERGIGHPVGRYQFCYAEDVSTPTGGVRLLTFYGPLTTGTRERRERYRVVQEEAIRTVHHRKK